MGVSNFREAADELLGGRLAEVLATDLSDEKCARQLMDSGIDVSRETVRRWRRDLGITSDRNGDEAA